MPGEPKPPYIRKVGERDGISIWVVDGFYVRTNLNIEFTNFAHHYVFDFIPENEFWLDREAAEDEQEFFVAHLFIEYELMRKGMPHTPALEAADREELRRRHASGDLGRAKGVDGRPEASKVHLALWKRLGNVNVWIVDGRLVRSAFFVDFTEGGHDYVYRFVPKNEIWIDNDLFEDERPYVLLHELHERALMASGWKYERAHEESSRIELRARHDASAFKSMLSAEESAAGKLVVREYRSKVKRKPAKR